MALGAAIGEATARAGGQATARQEHATLARPAPDPPYAGLVTRVIAFAVDAAVINAIAILVAAVVALVFSILPSGDIDNDVALVLGGVGFALWAVGYFVAFWTTTGQTPGDRLLQIAVRRVDGQRLRPRHALVRLVGMVLAAPLLLGYLPILITDHRRGLHDWLAGTVVTVEGRP